MLAMPAEKSGQDEFDFEYGTSSATTSSTSNRRSARCSFASTRKVTERERAPGRAAEGAVRLAAPPRAQVPVRAAGPGRAPPARVRGRRRRAVRQGGPPDLMRRAIAELQEAGIEPDIWKIEGLDQRDDCVAIAEQCRDGRSRPRGVRRPRPGRRRRGRRPLAPRGARRSRLPGFAIGRSIWWEPLKAFVDGSLPRDPAARRSARTTTGSSTCTRRQASEGRNAWPSSRRSTWWGVQRVVARRRAAGAGRSGEDDPRDREHGHPRDQRDGGDGEISEYHTHVRIRFRLER